MKKGLLLNSRITAVISEMGHTDTIVIADAGLPIPQGVERIDLALQNGVPDFITTLKAMLTELKIEKATMAKEVSEKNSLIESQAVYALGRDIKIDYVTHEQFKELTKDAKAVIRTGECTPYANIILHSGVVF